MDDTTVQNSETRDMNTQNMDIPEPKELVKIQDLNVKNITIRPDEIAKIKKTIDLTRSADINVYGREAQKAVGSLCSDELQKIGMSDLGDDVSDKMITLITELKGCKIEEDEGFLSKIFKNKKNKLIEYQTKHTSVMASVKVISDDLEDKLISLSTDVSILDKLYDVNEDVFRNLTEYIIAGKEYLEEVKSTLLFDLIEKAKESGQVEDYNKAKDLVDAIDRFERRLSNIMSSRTLALQQAPEIRIIQGTNMMLIERIQSSIDIMVPAYQNQLTMRSAIHKQGQALKAVKASEDALNEVLLDNAKLTHQQTTETAAMMSDTVIKQDTLLEIYDILTQTAKDLVQINEEARIKRNESEKTLLQREEQYKLEMKNTATSVLNESPERMKITE